MPHPPFLPSFLSHTYIQGLPAFEHDRAKTDRDSTTMLSPWIHFGSLSVRHAYYRVAKQHAAWAAAGVHCCSCCLDFLQPLGLREYSCLLFYTSDSLS